jgi:hypothetical protein
MQDRYVGRPRYSINCRIEESGRASTKLCPWGIVKYSIRIRIVAPGMHFLGLTAFRCGAVLYRLPDRHWSTDESLLQVIRITVYIQNQCIGSLVLLYDNLLEAIETHE